ncbi:MAG: hypothetical protein JSV88_31555 [Candidatus Aminicenantes bacterium]|nr:MAG: hypothetical protein JSV88_31555 [Candidatus Aminicenantes bacterium]
MERLIIHEKLKEYVKSIKRSMHALAFSWKIKIEILDNTGIEPENGKSAPRFQAPSVKLKQPEESIDVLIEAGSYEKALEILSQFLDQDPGHREAADKIGKLENWLRMKKQIRESDNYSTAVDLLEKLTLEVPAGAGQQQLLDQLNQLKTKWQLEIEGLQRELDETRDLKKKSPVLEQLIKIAPPEMKEDFIRRKKENDKKIQKEQTFLVVFLLGISLAAIAALLVFSVIIPGIYCSKNIKNIEEIINSNPEQAKLIIENIEQKCDSEKIAALKELAEEKTREKRSQPLIDEARKWAEKNNFERAFAAIDRIKKEIYKGISPPQWVKQVQEQIKNKASHYYLEQARGGGDPGEKYINYHKASKYSPHDESFLTEMSTYLEKNKDKVLKSLKRELKALLENKTLERSECERAKYLKELCIKIKPTDMEVLALNEEIYERCK